MVYLLIRFEDLNQRSIPSEFADFVTQELWSDLNRSYNASSAQGNSWACLAEICICIVFAFPCIFCCHPLMAATFSENTLRSDLNQMNMRHFGGQPVLCLSTGVGIQLNTDYITSYSPQLYIATTPAYASAQPIYIDNVVVQNQNQVQAQPQFQPPVTALPTAVPKTAAPRTMAVVLPEGVAPGNVLRVRSPDNMMVEVTAPPNCYPGQQIMVNY